MPLFRRKRMPWWTRPLMFISVLFALIYSERHVPVITKPITLIGLIEFGRSIPNRIKNLEKRFRTLSF